MNSPIVTGLKRGGCGLPTAPGLVPIILKLDKLGRRAIIDASRLVIAEAASETGIAPGLAIDMSQDRAGGIDNPISARQRFHGLDRMFADS